ncbi:hypothetical protein CEXT_699031 [Caerostris extrusa]|uniref:Uncharacterized protein n=1 Tax=Caerostris extrusa TaxID=172846 RepID=A0AAV4VV82_CAEEX|nr:hypothetical protein CEXT_699031 [Caerostris extrusa]
MVSSDEKRNPKRHLTKKKTHGRNRKKNELDPVFCGTKGTKGSRKPICANPECHPRGRPLSGGRRKGRQARIKFAFLIRKRDHGGREEKKERKGKKKQRKKREKKWSPKKRV